MFNYIYFILKSFYKNLQQDLLSCVLSKLTNLHHTHTHTKVVCTSLINTRLKFRRRKKNYLKTLDHVKILTGIK